MTSFNATSNPTRLEAHRIEFAKRRRREGRRDIAKGLAVLAVSAIVCLAALAVTVAVTVFVASAIWQ